MGFSRNRLRRLERSGRARCSECSLPPDGPGRIAVVYDESPGSPGVDFPDGLRLAERCERCARPLWCVLRVVYDSADKEGGGGNT